jgi:hypothetical protein
MEPRESGSYSVPSFLSTPRKNLAINWDNTVKVFGGYLTENFELNKLHASKNYPFY